MPKSQNRHNLEKHSMANISSIKGLTLTHHLPSLPLSLPLLCLCYPERKSHNLLIKFDNQLGLPNANETGILRCSYRAETH